MRKEDMPSPVKAGRARKKALRQATPFQFAIADRIDFLNAAAWDALTGSGTFFLCRDYLRLLHAAIDESIALGCRAFPSAARYWSPKPGWVACLRRWRSGCVTASRC
jgi:hypothetical protein